jgi:hypothetical protein
MMRVNMAQNLIELLNYERKHAFKCLITGDEAWIYLDNSASSI